MNLSETCCFFLLSSYFFFLAVIDFECLKSANSRLFECSYKKGFEIGRKGSLTNILCL